MGKIYYNQADSRWANHPYPGPTKANATVKSAGCGPTCCAMVVSSCKETIYPNTMCDISRENGFRASTGTDFGLFSYVANRWGLKTRSVKSSYEALQACKDGYFVVISCGEGLWTTGGHYILAVGADGDKIEIYDPYLYNGKFNQLGRQGKVNVQGNSCWVQIDTFKAYSNAQAFYAYRVNEEDEYKPVVKPDNIKKVQQWINDTYGFNLAVNGKADNILKEALILSWKIQCNKVWGANFASDKYGRPISGGFGKGSKEFARQVIRNSGNSGKMIKFIQAMCWFHGYNNNTFSGNYGSGTVEDVHNFKIQHGLSTDGTCVGQGFWTKSME